jgi:hypothetical protein
MPVSDLEKKHRPESEDPDFWDVWTLKNERNVDWDKIADDGLGILQVNQMKLVPTRRKMNDTPACSKS